MTADARVAVLISGRGSNMQALVRQASGYRVALVASDRPEAAGLAWARAQGIETFALSPKGIGKAAYEDALDAALRSAGIEVVALAGYMRLLSPTFVDRWRGRVVNIHPSLLPLYKGLDTHARAIAAGDPEAGCSVHVVTEELDGGRVLAQARVPIVPGDTADRLAERVLAAEHRLYPQALKEFVRAMSPDTDAVLARLRSIVADLPAVEEQSVDGDPVFRVEGGDAFARSRRDDGGIAILVRVDGREEQARLAAGAPTVYLVPPDTEGWIAIRVDAAGDGVEADWATIGDRVAHSWELAAPARLLEAGGR